MDRPLNMSPEEFLALQLEQARARIAELEAQQGQAPPEPSPMAAVEAPLPVGSDAPSDHD